MDAFLDQEPDGGEDRLPGNVILLPILGSIAAGRPQEERETLEGFYPLPRTDSARPEDYLLRVTGDSMTGDHIIDGDLAHVRPGAEIREGGIVVALVDGESTIKRLRIVDSRILLRALNPAYRDIAPVGELAVQGRVVGVIRAKVD